jgi:heme-degrading monooxygenase HmoA
MFVRVAVCTLKPETKEQFVEAARTQLLPNYKDQPGFVDILTLISDERPDQAMVMAVWNTRGDADKFYQHSAPLVDVLKPYIKSQEVVHYSLEKSSKVFAVAPGTAA